MKLTWVLVVATLAVLQPFSSNAAKKVQKGKFVVKQISNKMKTVCPSQKKNLGQVLSIVSSVDLTLRFTHSRISSLETAAKRLKKGKPGYFVENEYKPTAICFSFVPISKRSVIESPGQNGSQTGWHNKDDSKSRE